MQLSEYEGYMAYMLECVEAEQKANSSSRKGSNPDRETVAYKNPEPRKHVGS